MSYPSFTSKVRILFFIALLCLVFAGGMFTKFSYAETQPAGQGIQVSPVIIDLNSEKGKTYKLKITVTNVTAGDLILKSSAVDFRAKDESGNPYIIDEEQTGQNRAYSFKKWVKPMSSLYLKTKESRVVSVEVNVPPDAEAGGHYGVIRFSGVSPGLADKNVALIASVGVLVLTRVEGRVNEQLSVKDIFVEQNRHKKSVLETGPFNLVTRLENTGNVHVKPSGNVTVKNFFGSTIATLQLADQPKNILPASIRRFEQTVDKKWLFGRYTVSFNGVYGVSGKIAQGSASFWVIPYKIITILIAFVAATVWAVKYLLKRYKAKIIKQAKKHNKNIK